MPEPMGERPMSERVVTLRAVDMRDAEVADVLESAFPTDAEARLVRALADDPPALIPGLSLGAYRAGVLVGYLLFTRIWIGDAASHALSLAPVAVAPDVQGEGIGTLLMLDGLRRARAAGERAVVVLGHPEYYERFGFKPARPYGIEPPWERIPDEAWLLRELQPNGATALRGTVQYAAAFNEVT